MSSKTKIKINVSYEATTREYELDRTLPIDQHLAKICDILNLIHEKDKWSILIPKQNIYLRTSDLTGNFPIEKGMEFKIKLHPRVECEQILASFENTDNEIIKKNLFNLNKIYLKVSLFFFSFGVFKKKIIYIYKFKKKITSSTKKNNINPILEEIFFILAYFFFNL